jgi:hypothetical protein
LLLHSRFGHGAARWAETFEGLRNAATNTDHMDNGAKPGLSYLVGPARFELATFTMSRPIGGTKTRTNALSLTRAKPQINPLWARAEASEILSSSTGNAIITQL